LRKTTTFRDFDWTLLGFVLLIAILGVLQIYSATNAAGSKFAGFHVKQIYWILAGMGLMFIMSRIDYHLLIEHIHWAYAAGLLSLIAVMAVGVRALGAKR
jgi:rod shape determining protein RodA